MSLAAAWAPVERPGLIDLWLALAAGRLLLRRPEDTGLRRLVAQTLPADEPRALAEGIAAGAAALFDALAAHPGREPLGRISDGCRLSGFDLDLLGLAVLPCLSEDAAAAVTEVTGGARRLPLGLGLKLLFGDAADPAAVRVAVRGSPLWTAGLLQPGEAVRPLLERRLDPTETLIAALDGAAPSQVGEGWRPRLLEPPPRPAESIRRVAERLGVQPQVCVHLAGQPERAEQALALAAGPDGALVLDAPDDPQAAPPWAEAQILALGTGALVALRTDASQLTAPCMAAPLPVIAPPSFVLRGPQARLVRLEVGANDPLELSDAWRAALGLEEAEADELGGRNWLDGDVPRLVAAALPAGVPRGPGARLEYALAEVASLSPPRALRLATRRQPQVPWGRLVVPAETQARLADLVLRVRRRVTVQLRWGLGGGGRGRSVIGLLHGESGTGKTLAAEAVATRLQLPMLAVDLSLVVSKYIGETEKNLAELFAAAEGYAALLFFDEADALFGRRTNVQDAHDRYANIEVNYLLQRLEAFEGCAILATNLLQGVDEAFLRRFDQVVHFPRPGVAERLAIWRGHLPQGRLDQGVAVEDLAVRFELTGGEIRNAALGAAFAAADGDGVVTLGLLEAAVAEEFNKKGRPFPGRPGGVR